MPRRALDFSEEGPARVSKGLCGTNNENNHQPNRGAARPAVA